jgi:hypothetical protein
MGYWLIKQQPAPFHHWRVSLLPAFYESPANSARLTGR